MLEIKESGRLNIEQTLLESGRAENDFYPTPSGITRALRHHCPQLPYGIFEPCAGDRAISAIFEMAAHPVICSDILYPKTKPRDATTKEFWEFWAEQMKNYGNWATVTNPPFSLASKILPLAFEYSPWGVAFLLRISYLEPTSDRAQWLQDHADCLRLYMPFNPRPKFRRDKKGTDPVTIAWIVFQKSWSWKAIGVSPPFAFVNDWKQG